jgi:hypothetical protein
MYDSKTDDVFIENIDVDAHWDHLLSSFYINVNI